MIPIVTSRTEKIFAECIDATNEFVELVVEQLGRTDAFLHIYLMRLMACCAINGLPTRELDLSPKTRSDITLRIMLTQEQQRAEPDFDVFITNSMLNAFSLGITPGESLDLMLSETMAEAAARLIVNVIDEAADLQEAVN